MLVQYWNSRSLDMAGHVVTESHFFSTHADLSQGGIIEVILAERSMFAYVFIQSL